MRNNRLHQNNIRRTARHNTDAVQLMVTPRQPNLHVCASAWGRESAGTRNNRLHQNNMRRTARHNTDAVQFMVTPRHPNLQVCAAAWGQESAGTHNNRLHQNNIRHGNGGKYMRRWIKTIKSFSRPHLPPPPPTLQSSVCLSKSNKLKLFFNKEARLFLPTKIFSKRQKIYSF